MKRVIIFWDYSNFLGTVGELSGKRDFDRSFDYKKFVETLTKGMDLIKVYLACSHDRFSEEGKDQKRHFDSVDRQDYFYVKRFERMPGRGEKQVDTYLATQIVALAYENAYDIGIIISGDEDFVPAIEIVQQKGKIILVVSSGKALSDELIKKADRVVSLNDQGDLNFKNFMA